MAPPLLCVSLSVVGSVCVTNCSYRPVFAAPQSPPVPPPQPPRNGHGVDPLGLFQPLREIEPPRVGVQSASVIELSLGPHVSLPIDSCSAPVPFYGTDNESAEAGRVWGLGPSQLRGSAYFTPSDLLVSLPLIPCCFLSKQTFVP